MVQPQLAVFGRKDYQQLQVIRYMATEMSFPVEILPAPTLREPDGLAMSSRNAYLSADERHRALALSRGIKAAQALYRGGTTSARALTDAVRRELVAANLREDYVELVDATRMTPLTEVAPGQPARLLVAAFSGTTRLIDNEGIAG
jgi:pantoate--beta-alanine ligase